MAIKDVLQKLYGRVDSAHEEHKIKLSPEELELLSYKKEEYRDGIKKELQEYRKKKLTEFLNGKQPYQKHLNTNENPKEELYKKYEEKAYIKERIRLAKAKGKRKAKPWSKKDWAKLKERMTKEEAKELKKKKPKIDIKKLKKAFLEEAKKGKVAERLERLLIQKPDTRKLHYVYGKPKGMITGQAEEEQIQRPLGILNAPNPFANKSNHLPKSKNILSARNPFMR